MKTNLFLIATIVLLALSACSPDTSEISPDPYPAMSLTSPAFADGEPIPDEYTCKGADTSPELDWGDPPEGTQSFALIMDDVDAPSGIFVHWVIYNIPATSRSLPATVPADPQLPDGSLQGVNTADQLGYAGPCPPSGTHRYVFRLYALDTVLNLPTKVNKARLLGTMQFHILAEGRLIGKFKK